MNYRTVSKSAALALLVTAAAGGAAPRTTQLRGKVLQVDTKAGAFVMQRGASKSHPTARVAWDGKTRWTGLPRPKHDLHGGDSVLVTVAEPRPGSFRAVEIQLRDPKAAAGSVGVHPEGR